MKTECKHHLEGERCNDCGYGISVFEPLELWLRGLDKLDQWLVGLPIMALGLWSWCAETFREYQPGEPQKAIWVQLILLVVVVVLSELLRPKPNIENARPAGLGEFQVPTTTEGRHVPIMWGTVRQRGPNVVWYGDLSQIAITEKIKTGLWSSETITKGFRYELGMQFAMTRGPNVVLKRVWIGDDQVFSGTISSDGATFDIDQPTLFGGDDLGNGGLTATCDFYTGSSTQAVNAYLDDANRQRVTTAITPTAPRYTGTCYVVARELTSAAAQASDKGAYLGNSTTIKAWSFELERYPALFSGQSAGQNSIGVDANPVNVIYEILTNDEWGFGFSSADIDLTNFLAASNTMISEANGFSLLLDAPISAKDLLGELQRQIEGVAFISQVSGKWTIKLARDDYDIDLVPQLTDANVTEVRDFTRGSWEDTTNTITVQYDKRDDDYKLSFALAQDMANAMIQGNGTVPGANAVTGSVTFPGVKSSALAANLAWRELRGQSYPLARMQLVVNRQMWDVLIGDVVAWTNVQLGYVKLPVRITRVDYGRLQDNKMTLTVVQDVFKQAAASMGTPPPTGWSPPSTTLSAYPAAEKLAFECPRGILVRDPLFAGDDQISKILCGARNQVGEVAFDIGESNSVGSPSTTSFALAGSVVSFFRIGKLVSNLAAGTAIPTATITIDADPDSQSVLESAFDDTTALSDLGTNLTQIVMVNNEFMLVQKAQNNVADVDLQNVYRGALDSVQSDHSAGDEVYLMHLGMGLTDTVFNNTYNVNIVHRMKTSTSIDTNTDYVSLTMAKRALRPYAPAALLYNGVANEFEGSGTAGAIDAEGDGSGENNVGFQVDWWRRRYDASDEVAALLGDVDPDSAPLAAGTEYEVRVFVDPSGSNTEIASSPIDGAWIAASGATALVIRNELIDIAAAGTEIRVQIQARHDVASAGETNLTSRHTLQHDFTPESENDGLFYLGGNIGTGPSSSYTVTTAGAHTLDIGATPSAGNARYRINGGSWLNITLGGTATAALSISDTIEVQQSTAATPDPNFIWIDNPSATRVAYGTL